MIMNKKRILIVSASFYPRNSPRSFRTTELANEFARQGHTVVVYVPFNGFDYSEYSRKTNITIKDIGPLKFKNVRITGSKLEKQLRRLLKRLLELVFEYPKIELMFKVAKRIKQENGYDLLISIAVPYPIHWGVAKARSKQHKIAAKWVADCGDPYMGDTTDSFNKLFYFKYLEKWFSKKADYISIPFEGARKAYYSEFQDKIKVIPQGFKTDELKLQEYRKKYSYPIFAYAGAFIQGRRDPRDFLDYLSNSDIEFRFIVYTPNPGVLGTYEKILGHKLDIREIIHREDLLRILSEMDFLINFDNNTGTQLPSKLIDYAIVGRPVLNITDSFDFMKFEKFMKGDYSDKMELQSPDNFNIKTITKKFIALLAEK
jgi:glycosyltransferase involved in cell wall biosynthesis